MTQLVKNPPAMSMGFSRQEYWSGLSFPSPGDLPDPGIEPRSPALQADALPPEPPGKHPQNFWTWENEEDLVRGIEKEIPTRNSGWCWGGGQQAPRWRPQKVVLSTFQMSSGGWGGAQDLKGGRRSLMTLAKSVCKASWSQQLDDGEFWKQ